MASREVLSKFRLAHSSRRITKFLNASTFIIQQSTFLLIDVLVVMARVTSQKIKGARKANAPQKKAETAREKETRGSKGNFSGARLQTLKDAFPTFMKLPKRSKQRTAFFASFMPGFLALYPLDDYPLPPDTIKPLPPLTPAERAALTPREKEKRRKQEDRQKDHSDEHRYFVAVKQWFCYQEQNDERDTKNLFETYLSQLNESTE
ncbi:hypothetical protein VNI00_018902 [Paramarasmius palmivorus]|uniref:Uncharacterized protein n=1 Tax=Paramarasmius palmivorus TaxID=297713 RepID=A0AAW0ASP5_9AGAR